MPIGDSGSMASMPGTRSGCKRLSAISSTTRERKARLRLASLRAAATASGEASAPATAPAPQAPKRRTRFSSVDRNTSRLSDSSAVPRAGAATRT